MMSAIILYEGQRPVNVCYIGRNKTNNPTYRFVKHGRASSIKFRGITRDSQDVNLGIEFFGVDDLRNRATSEEYGKSNQKMFWKRMSKAYTL
jgi:ABC-type cobalamin/Fe3+-siderophores transport system ATPase subunit